MEGGEEEEEALGRAILPANRSSGPRETVQGEAKKPAAKTETKHRDGWLAPKIGRPPVVFFSLAMSCIGMEGGAAFISVAALAAHWRRQTHGDEQTHSIPHQSRGE